MTPAVSGAQATAKVSNGAPARRSRFFGTFEVLFSDGNVGQRPPAAGARRNPVLLLKIISRDGLSFLLKKSF